MVTAALVFSGLQPLVHAATAATTDIVSAEASAVSIARTEVKARPEASHTTPAQAAPARVRWPKGGSARVTVPSRGKAVEVGDTAVAVTAPRVKGKAKAADQVAVTTYGNDKTRQLGGHGTAFRITEVDGGTKVGVMVDVSGFADAYGGDFESRLRLTAKPACVLTTPDDPNCATGTQIPSHVDLTAHTLIADVPASDPDTVYVVIAAVSGETGSATATKLSSSSKWSVGLQSGDFSWSLPLPQVAALSGDAPDIDLGYSSQAVDGQVAAENNQPSWVGQGWDLALPFLERRYNGCSDDGGDTGDLCWAGDELRLSLEGTSSALVRDKDAGDDIWRAKEDPGWRVQRFRGADNGDNDGEYWVVTTPQGTKYTFGRGKQATTGNATDSVFTVPVFGDDSGEPCHSSDLEDSWCSQAWRWNLDGVVDAHGNSSTFFYTQETNRYARNGVADRSTEYVRGGNLRDIVYSQRSGAEDTQAPARLHFTTGLRCTEAAGGSGDCPAFDADHASSYPDVPLDTLCASGDCTGDDQKAPTFFTGKLLRSVTAQRSDTSGGGWTDVDRLDFTYSFPEPSDGTSAALWLEKVQQTGLGGDGEQALPAVQFTGKEYANRADADPAAGAPAMRKLRISSVTDELSRRVEVGYSQPDACPIDNLPQGHYDTNTQDCFPGWRSNGDSSGFGVWHKYLTTRVTVVDTAGGAPNQTTEYRYRGTPAWHYDDDPLTPSERKSWSDWRGYGSVDVAKLSDPSYRDEPAARTLSLSRALYFRGMDGDRTADGGSKSVQVTDSEGTALNDLPYLRGKERESRQFHATGDGEADYELGGTIHGYTSAHTTDAGTDDGAEDDAHLVVENDAATRETVIDEADGSRSSRTTRLRSTYDSHGQTTAVTDTADGADTRCTKTSYARDAATTDAWMVAFPYRIRTYAGSCDDPDALVNGKDQYYDGSGTLGATITNGDVTRTVSAVQATGPDTVSQTVSTEATFDAYGRTLTETDGNGDTSRTVYTPDTGRLVTVTDTNPLGQAETTTLDPDRQQPVSVKDANGQATTNTYDPLGRLTSVREADQAAGDPPAQTFAYVLDPDHTRPPRVTTRQLQSGDTYVTTWAFLDSMGRDRQTQTVSPASTPSAPKTVVTDTRYDDYGNVAAESLPVVASGQAGSALLAVPADQVDETRYAYDSLGRVVRSAQSGQGSELWATTTAYYGDHVRTTPPAGGVTTTTWTDARDRELRKQEGVAPLQATTRYTYTSADQIATVTDPAEHSSTYAYDLLKRRTSADDPDAGPSRTSYDANGNTVSTWDAAALAGGDEDPEPTQTTDYDALDRPVARWDGASGTGTKTATWTYDSTDITNGLGQVASQTTHQDGKDYTVAVTGYDDRGRATGKRWTFPAGTGGSLHKLTYTVNYAYDAADHVVTTEYQDSVIGLPAETITTTFDALGNPSTLSGARSYISATGYAADGKLATRDYDNPHHGLRRAYAYEDGTQRLSRIQTLVDSPLTGSTAPQDDSYAWDPSGNLTSITDTTSAKPVATCHAYDGLDRLTHSWTTKQTSCTDGDSELTHDGPAGYNESWTYTTDGNIATARSLLDTREFEYGDADHPHAVTKAGHDSYAYDADGSMSKQVEALVPTTYDYDANQQMTSATTALLKKTKFVYTPGGSRMARIDPLGVATLYIDGQEITVALGVEKGTRYYNIAGTTVAERLFTGLLKWQLSDTQGSAQIAVLEGTSLLERTYYDPYGQIRTGSAPPVTDRGWLGKTKDPTTGLNALGARYYKAGIGRFLTTDPAFDPSSAQTANPYAYGSNNPVLYVDPTGLWSLSGAWNSVKEGTSAAWDWANENKGLIADVAVGIGVGIAIGAVCATGVGCLVLAGVAAGAAGAAAGYGVDVAEGKTDFSAGGLAARVGIGAASGLLGVGIGKAVGAGLRAAAGTAAGQAVRAGAGRATAAVTGAAARSGRAAVNAVRAGGSRLGTAARSAGKAAANITRKAKPTPITSTNPSTPDLLQAIATSAQRKVGGSGAVAGTRKHSYAENLLNRYQGVFGNRGLETEVSFLNGVRVPHGTAGSVRVDVLDAANGTVYDYKFVLRPPGLRTGQINRILAHVPGIRNVLEVNP
ncbi:RHS repeat-associated core domain-containing protein [Streptomyces sp. NPDC059718]